MKIIVPPLRYSLSLYTIQAAASTDRRLGQRYLIPQEGNGQFTKDRPGKRNLQIGDPAVGEYSVSADNMRLEVWMRSTDAARLIPNNAQF